MAGARQAGMTAIRPVLSLETSRVFAYRAMVEGIFRREGPSKSKITLAAKENLTQPLSAGIDPDTWNVEFALRQGLSFNEDPHLARFLSQMLIPDAIGEMLRDVSYHEIGHWEYPKMSGFGCPFDKPLHYTSFIEPIHEELVRSGKFQPDACKGLSMRIANAVTDVIDNFNVSSARASRRQSYSGQTLFWYLQGQENGHYSQEYSLFVKLNLALFGNSRDLHLLRRFIDDSPEMGMSVKRLARLFSPGAMYSRGHWEGLARAYAQEAVKYLDPADQDNMNFQYSAGSGQMGQPSPQQGGQGNEGQGQEDGEKQPGEGQKPGDDLKKGDKEKIMMGRKGGQGIPFYLDPTEALDAYYSGLAKRIPIRAAGKLPSASMQLVPFLFEPYDPEVHDIGDIHMGRLGLDVAGRSVLPMVARSKLTIDIPIKKEKKHLPEFVMALIDSSGSMMGFGFGHGQRMILPWGDQSYYHFALLTFYGIMRFFENERILHKMGVSAGIFSDETLTASGIDDVKKLILNPKTGGTALDVRKVMERMRGRDNVLFSMISDGEITNWALIRDEFIALAKRNQFFMIQIGRKSQASRDLEAAGLSVEYVNSHRDIVRLAIDLTVGRYRAVIASKVAREAKKYHNLV